MEESTPILHKTVEAIAGFVYFIPLVCTLMNKKLQTNFFVLFAAYFTWEGLVNLMVWTAIVDSDNFMILFECFYNMMDAPLLLLVLYATTPYKAIKQHLGKMLIVFALCIIVLLLAIGINLLVERIVAAAGVSLVLFYVCWIIYHTHSRASKLYSPVSSRQFIYYGLIFGSGCSIITFILTYVHKGGAAMDPDIFLIYHVSVIFMLCIVCFGFITYKKEPAFKLRHLKDYNDESEFKYL